MEFVEPVTHPFVLAAWSVDLHRLGPFVRHSARRKEFLASLAPARASLEGQGWRTRLLETTFLPPLPGSPRFDVVLLVDGADADAASLATFLTRAGVPGPQRLAAARNILRFGDTDASPGPVLLNHFVGSCTPEQAARSWGQVSAWYRDVLGVDNSTLLQPSSDDEPYLVINYAVVPGPVPRFMAAQLARPSFYRSVIAPLSRIGARACPLFARRIA